MAVIYDMRAKFRGPGQSQEVGPAARYRADLDRNAEKEQQALRRPLCGAATGAAARLGRGTCYSRPRGLVRYWSLPAGETQGTGAVRNLGRWIQSNLVRVPAGVVAAAQRGNRWPLGERSGHVSGRPCGGYRASLREATVWYNEKGIEE